MTVHEISGLIGAGCVLLDSAFLCYLRYLTKWRKEEDRISLGGQELMGQSDGRNRLAVL
jgi:hypothetical protein